jgi:branched-chain amino acid transport system substrate-binding protein
MAKMKSTPINDFTMKNVSIREDGQVMRPIYPVTVMAAADSKSKYDYYKVGTPIPPEQAFRPMAEGGCDFVKK